MHVKPVRYQDQGCLHFITFSCYRRMRLLDSPAAKQTFEQTLERVRVWYGCYISGYVVMPEHVHLLISEPERRVARALFLGFLSVTIPNVGCPVLAFFARAGTTDADSESFRPYATRSRNKTSVHPTFTRTAPASSKK